MKKIYLILILFLCFIVKAQVTPGGITNVQMEYWLKANQLMPTLPQDGADVVQWNDLSGNSRNFVNLEANPFYPKFLTSSMNFHPSVDFYFLDADDGGPTDANNRRRKLMTSSSFAPDPNRSYFVIWVSELDGDYTLSASDATVFGLNAGSATGNTRGNQFGWRTTSSTARLWHRTSNTDYLQNPIPTNPYGIAMTILPNNTSVPQQVYLNALQSTTTMAGRALGVDSSQSVLGVSSTGTTAYNYFFGEIMEVIVMSRSGSGNTLSNDELKKINTYLGVKYGITLDRNSQPDYMLSDGTVIYNRNNAGYSSYSSDIVAIARDDASGLNQKQALSTDNPGMGIYLGSLTETNDENTSIISDKSALVFGSTGLEGSTQYNYGVGTQFSNYTFQSFTDPLSGIVTEERVNDLSRNIYRAKVTGGTPFVVNILPPIGQWVVVSDNANFTPSNTRIYKAIGGVAQNVTINDGDYVGFVYYMRAPGGVTNGLRMWLNASEASTITTNPQGQVLTWVDYAGFGTTYRRRPANNESAQYVQSDERTNFHPTLIFDSATDYLITDSGPMSVANPLNSTFYTVINHNFARDRSYFLGFGTQVPGGTNSRRPVFGVYQDGLEGRGRFRSAGANNSTQRLFNPGATMIAGYHWTRGVSIEYEFDAYTETRAHTSVTTPQMNGVGMLGAGSLTDSYLLGTMPEVFAYEGVLTTLEREKINSYLGLKYGITLDLRKYGVDANELNFDYKFSDGTEVWYGNDAIHKGYHKNIAAIIRDDNADLNNRQSRSTDVGAIVHMGIGRKLGINPDLDYIANDRTSLAWGHNGGSLLPVSFVGDPDICGEFESAISSRVWLADNMDINQTVMVAAHGEAFPYSGANYQVYLLVADNPAKFQAKNWDQVIPMTFQNDMHVANYIFNNRYTYFSFAAKQVAFCEGCEFSGIKSFDFTRANWPRGYKGPSTFNLGDDFNLKIEVLDPSNVLRSRYPRNSSLGSLREYRRGVGEVTTKISFQNGAGSKKSASTSFELFDIDRAGRAVDNAQVIGYCNGSPVYPKMYYEYRRPERSRYTIQNLGRAVAKPRLVRYNGSSGYTNLRGRVFVEFEYPVDEIRIIYTTPNSGTSSNMIGIGSMEFYCPAPLPPPNEDGLILTKQGPTTAKLCDVVDYTFRVVNTNCAEKTVKLSDLLPEGMTWVNDSFISGGQAYTDASGYGTRNLIVTDLVIPGGSASYTFRASAIFDQDAIAKVYENRAKLEYESLGLNKEIESIDRLTGDPLTLTNALASSRLLPVTTEFTSDKSCFNLNGEIEVTLQVTNPNASTFSDMFLITDFNSEVFEVVPNSIQTSSGFNLTPDLTEEGAIIFEDFNLPAGTSWVKFKVRASNDLNDYEIDPLTNNPIDVDFNFELFSEADQECLESVFANANGTIEMQFCTVCYYAPITVGNAANILDSEGFAAITSLDRTNSEWITLRGNAFLVLESQSKGFVITRLTTTQINQLAAVEGMLVYDTTINCLKMYNGTTWGCLEQGCVDE